MSQISRKWIADDAVDNSKIDNSDSYVMASLTTDYLHVRMDSTTDGTALFYGPVITSSDLTSAGSLTVLGLLTANNDASVVGKIHALNDVLMNEELTVLKDVQLARDLYVTGNASVGGDATVGGDSTVVGSLAVMEESWFYDNLDVHGDFYANSDMTVSGDTTMGGLLRTVGNITGLSSANISGSVSAGVNVNAGVDINAGQDLSVTRDADIGRDATVAGNMSVGSSTLGSLIISGPFTANGHSTFNGQTDTSGALKVVGPITVTGATNLNAVTNVNNTLNANSSLNVTGLASMNTGLAVLFGATVTGGLTVDVLTVTGSSINAVLATLAVSNINVTGTVIGNIVTLSGFLTASAGATVLSGLSVSGGLGADSANIPGIAILGPTTVNGTLNLNGNLSGTGVLSGSSVSALGTVSGATLSASSGSITGSWTAGSLTSTSTISVTTDALVSGRVGIGTNNPGAYDDSADKLVVYSPSANTGMTIATPNNKIGSIFFADGVGGGDQYVGNISYNHFNNKMDFGTNGATRLSILSNGKVGIATDNPDNYDDSGDNLVVYSGTDNAGMSIITPSNKIGNIYFGDGTGASAYVGNISYDHFNDQMYFGANGATRLRILSNGYVGINTGTVSGALHVYSGVGTSTYQRIQWGGNWGAIGVESTGEMKVFNTVGGGDLVLSSNNGTVRAQQDSASATGSYLKVQYQTIWGAVGMETSGIMKVFNTVGSADLYLQTSNGSVVAYQESASATGSYLKVQYSTIWGAVGMETTGLMNIFNTVGAGDLQLKTNNGNVICRQDSASASGSYMKVQYNTIWGAVGMETTGVLKVFNTVTDGDLILQTAGTGYVGINTSNAAAPLHLYKSSGDLFFQFQSGGNTGLLGTNGSAEVRLQNLVNGGHMKFFIKDTGGTEWDVIDAWATNTDNINGSRISINAGQIQQWGSTIHTHSDRRIKHDIKPMDSCEVLNKIVQLEGVTYKYIPEVAVDYKDHPGLIAQEVEKVFPDLVGECDYDRKGFKMADMKSVLYQDLTAYLVEAVKALKHKNDLLEARVTALEARQV